MNPFVGSRALGFEARYVADAARAAVVFCVNISHRECAHGQPPGLLLVQR